MVRSVRREWRGSDVVLRVKLEGDWNGNEESLACATKTVDDFAVLWLNVRSFDGLTRWLMVKKQT